VQVYRPYCSTVGTVFCQKSYSCISVNDSCAAQPVGEKWKISCTGDTIYSIAKQGCIYRTTGLVVPRATNNADGEFVFMGEATITVDVGTGFYPVCTH